MQFENIVSRHIDTQGGYIFGYADLSELLSGRWSKTPYALVIGKGLDNSVVDGIIENDGPTKEYLDHYHQVNTELDQLASDIVEDLNEEGVHSTFVWASAPNDQLGPDYEMNLRSDFSHKMAATRAGLGWIGKTALLVTHEFGPRVRFVTVLADQPLGVEGWSIDESQCGKCKLCVLKCPAQAANGKSWTKEIDRDEFYDPFKCRRHCKSITKEKTGKDGTVCGMCVAVCPIGRKGGE